MATPFRFLALFVNDHARSFVACPTAEMTFMRFVPDDSAQSCRSKFKGLIESIHLCFTLNGFHPFSTASLSSGFFSHSLVNFLILHFPLLSTIHLDMKHHQTYSQYQLNLFPIGTVVHEDEIPADDQRCAEC